MNIHKIVLAKVEDRSVRISSDQDVEITYSDLMPEHEVVERHGICVHACRNLLVI